MTTHYIQTLGVAKCREILKGMPDKTADTYVGDTDTYFSTEFGSYFDHAEEDWFDSDYRSYGELMENYENVFWLNDMRKDVEQHDTDSCTDIANHISPRTVVWDLGVDMNNQKSKLNKVMDISELKQRKQKNCEYLDVIPKPKPFSVRMRRQRIKA